VHRGAADPVAREKMHNAGSIAGMAFGNAFLGTVHARLYRARIRRTWCELGFLGRGR
jgi:alcohol dehydrogenase class IV